MPSMTIKNRTGGVVWLGLYTLNDVNYSFTVFPLGARKKLTKDQQLSVEVKGEKIQIVFWNAGSFGSMLAKPKTVFTTSASICDDQNGYYVYNSTGEPTAMDKIDHIVVLMLENRSFDNLLGWLYADEKNVPPRNIPPPPAGVKPSYLGLEERKYWNTNPASGHDTAPEDQRVYVRKGAQSDTKPDPNPREVCPSFVEQMFGTEAPAADQEPNMWGFVQNYAGLKNNKDVSGIMECFAPDQASVAALSQLAKDFAVCDRWFGSVPCETWPNRSFLHAGTSFGRLNNCDQKYVEDCVPNAFVYAGQRTIIDVLAEQDIRWALYQPAQFRHTLLSAQFWTVFQKLTHASRPLDHLERDLKEDRAPQYIFIEPDYVIPASDQHPPHSVRRGDDLIHDVYSILRRSGVWFKTLWIITYDEHGGCYDHVPPPKATPPDDYSPQFEVGELKPFKRFGPRVPAVVVSPYVEPGTVFRGDGAEYDHTSILASIRDWIFRDKRDILGPNDRIRKAPTIWPVLTRTVGRSDTTVLDTEESAEAAGERREEEPVDGKNLDYRQLVILAMAEVDRILAIDAATGDESALNVGPDEYTKLVEEKLQELRTMIETGEFSQVFGGEGAA